MLRVSQQCVQRIGIKRSKRLVAGCKECDPLLLAQRFGQPRRLDCADQRGDALILSQQLDDGRFLAADGKGLDDRFAVAFDGAIRTIEIKDIRFTRIHMQHGMKYIGDACGVKLNLDVGIDACGQRGLAQHGTGRTILIGMDYHPPRFFNRCARDVDGVVDHRLVDHKHLRRKGPQHRGRCCQQQDGNQHKANYPIAIQHTRLLIFR